jgi:hypothetical protein
MKHVRFAGGFALGCTTVLLAAAAFNTQDHPQQDHPRRDHPQQAQPPTEEEMMQMWAEAMEKYCTPAEQHEALAKRAGDWNFRAEFWMAPGTEPEVSEGTAHYSMFMDDRYLLGEYQAQMDMGEDEPVSFEGGGLTGYDRIKNEYQSIWIDNMSTAIMWMSGQSPDGGKTIELKGQMPDPMSGGYVPSRSVEKWVDENTWTMESYGPSPADGEEFMTMRITYTRAQ